MFHSDCEELVVIRAGGEMFNTGQDLTLGIAPRPQFHTHVFCDVQMWRGSRCRRNWLSGCTTVVCDEFDSASPYHCHVVLDFRLWQMCQSFQGIHYRRNKLTQDDSPAVVSSSTSRWPCKPQQCCLFCIVGKLPPWNCPQIWIFFRIVRTCQIQSTMKSSS